MPPNAVGKFAMRKQLIGLTVCFFCVLHNAIAALPIGPSGTVSVNFGSVPLVSDGWATYAIAGGSGDVSTADQLDAAVQTISASIINGQIVSDAGNPPAATGSATWSSSGQYIQTRPTGVRATLLMVDLQNSTGNSAASITISYDFTTTVPVTEEIIGVRAYYSLSGDVNSWTVIPAFSSGGVGRLNATLNISWPNGAHLYIVWADDNGSGTPDTACQFDNFTVNVTSAIQVPVTITNQPQDLVVSELQPATFTVDATGNPVPVYQWFRNGLLLTNATNAAYSIQAAALSDNGAEFFVIASNMVSNVAYTVTSRVATLTVLPDTNPPVLLGAMALGLNQVLVSFSERISQVTATNISFYSITGVAGTVTISNAVPDSSQSNVILSVSQLTENAAYVLTVNGIRDQASAGNLIASNSQASFMAVGFTPIDIGNPGTPGSVQVAPGGTGYNMAAVGSDIGGTSDQFFFDYQMRTGDFDMAVRLAALDGADAWVKAGLMARETLAANSRFAASLATPGISGCFYSWRDSAGANVNVAGSYPVNYPYTWLRLQRVGNVFSGYASGDGQNWTLLGSSTLAMPGTIYFGIAASSRSSTQASAAQFRDLQTAVGTLVPSPVLRRERPGMCSRRTGLVISEILYNPAGNPGYSNSTEFIEIYNSNPFYEDIGGYRISGSIDYVFPAGTRLAEGAFVVVARNPAVVRSTYGITNVFGPWTGAETNGLPAKNGLLRLRNASDAVLLEIEYSDRKPWPEGADGSGHSIVLARPSMGENEPAAWQRSDKVGGSPGRMDGFSIGPLNNVVINEFLAHAHLPTEEFIELYNHANQPVDISGCVLSDSASRSNQFVIPPGTIIPARGFVAFTESQMGFALNTSGETIYLWSPDLSSVLDAVRYDAQEENVSMGRYPNGAREFYRMKQSTPGAANSDILIDDVVINEIMYLPLSGDTDAEYVELYNKGTNAINLGGWKFVAGINFTFPTNAVIQPDGYVVVAKNKTTLLSLYTNLDPAITYGNFGGTLANRGERLALAKPDVAIHTNNLGVVVTNYNNVVVDEVTYRTGGRWGKWSHGGGSSLELINPRSNHRLADNWADSDETRKAPWTTVQLTGTLDNGVSGVAADALHVLLEEEGEFLLDNVEVLNSSGVNVIPNGTFESTTNGWYAEGTHEISTWETTEGDNSSRSLRVRASGRGDNGANKIRAPLSSSLGTSGTATLRVRVRWLAGYPELLLRLHGNWLEAPGTMIVPPNLGTPGARNSRAVNNAPPAIYEVTHNPVLPQANQSVVVTARVHDPDGISSFRLYYRVDPSTSYTPLNMTDDGNGGDAFANDGIYSATIPGQASGTLIAFYLEARDQAGSAATLFPKNATADECLIRFGETQPTGSIQTYRIWMTQATLNRWASRPKLSNNKLDVTFVYNDQRIIYNAKAGYKGSPFISSGYNSPIGNLCGYAVDFNRDDLFLGVTGLDLDYIPRDNSAIREQIFCHIIGQMGAPFNRRNFVNLFVNGNRRGLIYEDAQKPEGDYLESWVPDDSNGDLHKLDDGFEFYDDGIYQSFTRDNGDPAATLEVFTTTGGVKKTARYRWHWRKRSLHGNGNNYQNLFDLVDAANTSDATLYVSRMSQLVDIEEWMRIFVGERISGNWDSYGFRRGKNMYAYKPENGKWQLMTWDIDFFDATTWPPTEVADPVLAGRFFTTPAFQRIYLRVLQQAINGPLASQNIEPVIDARFNALRLNNISATDDTATIKSAIASKRSTMQGLIGTVPSTLTVSGNNPLSTNTNYVVISGSAPLSIDQISVNGAIYPITWTSATVWSLRLAVGDSNNVFVIQGLDTKGAPVPGATVNYTVNFTGQVAPPQGNVVFSEIMYKPAVSNAHFVELFNVSTNFTFDLSNWRINGLGYTFPVGTLLAPRSYILLVKDRAAFSSAYGALAATRIVDVFPGNLDPDGETLTLFRPVAGGEEVVDRVRYESNEPWPQSANGQGASLQLIDVNRDNSRVANWKEEQGWRYATFTGTNTVISPSILMIIPQGPGDVYIDDLVVVEGTNAEVGVNVINNGDFESPLAGSWFLGSNLTNSMIVTNVKHSGNSCLLLRASSSGSSYGTSINQTNTAFSVSNMFTLSFWYLPVSLSNLVIRTRSSSFTPNFSVAPSPPYTPGTNNSTARTLPELPPVWLNEVLAQNTGGLTDNYGEREPWIELYNSGSQPVSLSNWFLADNYTNLTQWAFPDDALIGPGQYLVVWADGQPEQSGNGYLHTSFRLGEGSGKVALSARLDGKLLLMDYLNYSNLSANVSYGDAPDGQPFYRQEFYFATPGASNNPALAPIRVYINEWMASNTRTIQDENGLFEDWFELYNAGSQPANLAGYYLTDDLGDPFQFRIPEGYVIPAGGYLLVWADNRPDMNVSNSPVLHVNFQLNRGGEAIGLYGPDGVVVDAVTFGPQTNDVSQGRMPDGSGTIIFMAEATPGRRNGGGVVVTNMGPPELAPIADTNVVEGNMLVLAIEAHDTNQPPVPFSLYLAPGAPVGVSLDGESGLLIWVPDEAQGPGRYNLTVIAAQTAEPFLSMERTFVVDVLESNLPPVFGEATNLMVNVGGMLNWTARATDPDIPANAISYGLAAGAPSGVVINSGSGLLSWRPERWQAGTNLIGIVATDNGIPALSATQWVSVVVIPPPENVKIVMQGNQVEIRWAAFPGKTYRVLSGDSIMEPVGNWQVLSPPLPATGNSLSFSTNINLQTPDKYFRIRQED